MKYKQVVIQNRSFYEIGRRYPQVAQNILVRWGLPDLHFYIRSLLFPTFNDNVPVFNSQDIKYLEDIDQHHKDLFDLCKLDALGNLVCKKPEFSIKKMVDYEDSTWGDTIW